MTTIQTGKFGCCPLSETDHQICQEKLGVLGAYLVWPKAGVLLITAKSVRIDHRNKILEYVLWTRGMLLKSTLTLDLHPVSKQFFQLVYQSGSELG